MNKCNYYWFVYTKQSILHEYTKRSKLLVISRQKTTTKTKDTNQLTSSITSKLWRWSFTGTISSALV